jgi:molybdopterin-guanine dinucleotide biosynthesis protein
MARNVVYVTSERGEDFFNYRGRKYDAERFLTEVPRGLYDFVIGEGCNFDEVKEIIFEKDELAEKARDNFHTDERRWF